MDYVSTSTFIAFFLGFFVGIPVGILIAHFFKNGKLDRIKALNILLFFVWIGFHIWGFYKGIDVPIIFDLVGGASVGHLLGFDLGDIISKFSKK